ncbi:MAG: biotin--[acetyl-CoA-carboxylase] ligase [Tepidisphaerales bacterium]
MADYPSYDLATLREGVRPFRLIWSPRMRSTNDRAITLRKRNQLFAPTIVVTGHQTAGRGRGNNVWFSNAGAVTVTFAVAVEPSSPTHHLPLVAGLAVRNAAAELASTPDIQLKWPNDIVHEGKKLGGLLCERVENVDLVGVGLNLNLSPADAPASLRTSITSLAKICGQILDPTDSLIIICKHILQTLARRTEQPFGAILADYTQYHALHGHRLTITNEGEATIKGVCEGIDDTGRLLVRRGKTLHRVVNGTVAVVEK